MEILYLCHPNFNEAVIEKIRDAYEKFIRNDDKRKSNASVTVPTCITSLAAYREYDFHRKPDIVLIQPELNWSDQDSDNIYFGYECAIDLLARKWPSHAFDLQFVTIYERHELLESVEPEHRKFIEIFRHNDREQPMLLGSALTPLHFDLMRKINTEDLTRMRIIRHQLVSLQSEIEQDDEQSGGSLNRLLSAVRTELKDLAILPMTGRNKVAGLVAELAGTSTVAGLCAKVRQAIALITEHERKALPEETEPAQKKLFRVLVLEDNRRWLTGISETMQRYFEFVNPSTDAQFNKYNLPRFWKEIRRSKDINLFIIDLIYLDAEEHYFPFNGLDIYAAIRKYHPFAVVRIISSLPRRLIAELAEAHHLKIQFKEIIPKRDGLRTVQALLNERAEDLIAECVLMEKKKTAFYPMPKQGVFNWPGVQTWIFDLSHNQPDLYRAYWERAFQLFRKIKAKAEIDMNVDWDHGNLPSSHMVYTFDEEYLESRIVGILTHRLLVLDLAIRNNDEIDLTEIEGEILDGYRGEKGIDASYLNKIGIEKKSVKGGDPVIYYRNLFPEEYRYAAEQFNKEETDLKKGLKEIRAVSKWFKDILSETAVFDNWDTLGLKFNPYRQTAYTVKRDTHKNKLRDAEPDIWMDGKYEKAIEGLCVADILHFLVSLMDQATSDPAQAIIGAVRQKYNGISSRRTWPRSLLMYAGAFSK